MAGAGLVALGVVAIGVYVAAAVWAAPAAPLFVASVPLVAVLAGVALIVANRD